MRGMFLRLVFIIWKGIYLRQCLMTIHRTFLLLLCWYRVAILNWVRVDGVGKYEVIGESIDDAAGEAFDKTAKLLGLDYPGGAALSRLAEKGTPNRFTFPRPMTDRAGLDFSFSGLKTFAANTINQAIKNENELTEQTKSDIAYAFQDAVVDTLAIKCKRALKETGYKTFSDCGRGERK